MSRKCDLTGKKTEAGKSRKHRRGKAGGVSGPWSRKATASLRTYRPNLVRNIALLVNGVPTKLTISNKILKRIKNYGHYKGVTLATTAQ